MCSDFIEKHPNKIGGEGKVEEIDESKFDRRKNHKGRIIEGKWVFGSVQVDDKTNCFFEPVEDRSSKTLMEIILRNVQPGTKIVTDCWRGCMCTPLCAFVHPDRKLSLFYSQL